MGASRLRVNIGSQKGYMKLVSQWTPTDIRGYCKKFSRHGDLLAPRICGPQLLRNEKLGKVQMAVLVTNAGVSFPVWTRISKL